MSILKTTGLVAGHWNKPLADNGAAAGITELGKLDALTAKPVLSSATRIGTGGS